MYSNDNIKFKYRIKLSSNKNFPYLIQRKFFFFWMTVEQENSIDDAHWKIKYLAKKESDPESRPGAILFEYTEKDYLVDKLKGTI